MGIGISLAPLAKLTISHGYYGPSQPGLELVATQETQQMLARARCRLRTLPDGVEIYAGAPFGDTPDRPAGPGMVLSFWLEAADPHLWTVTEPDWDGDAIRECLFLSEESSHNGDVPSASATLLPVRSKSFHDQFSDALTGKTLSLLGWRGGDPVWTGPLLRQGHNALDLELFSVPDGRYRLSLDGTDLREFFLTERPTPRFWGVFEVDLGTAKPAVKGQDPLSYRITFEPRKSFWRYVIRSLIKNRDLSGAQIVSEPKGITFSDAVADPAGEADLWVVESKEALPLYVSPASHHSFTLTLPAASGPAPPPGALPCPSADATRVLDTETTPKMVSTIYVTV